MDRLQFTSVNVGQPQELIEMGLLVAIDLNKCSSPNSTSYVPWKMLKYGTIAVLGWCALEVSGRLFWHYVLRPILSEDEDLEDNKTRV